MALLVLFSLLYILEAGLVSKSVPEDTQVVPLDHHDLSDHVWSKEHSCEFKSLSIVCVMDSVDRYSTYESQTNTEKKIHDINGALMVGVNIIIILFMCVVNLWSICVPQCLSTTMPSHNM